MMGLSCFFDAETMRVLLDRAVQIRQYVQTLMQKAEDGVSDAQYRLVLCYLRGSDGVKQDDQRAVYWFTKAERQDHVAAIFYLGVCYGFGMGFDRKYTKGSRFIPADGSIWICAGRI